MCRSVARPEARTMARHRYPSPVAARRGVPGRTPSRRDPRPPLSGKHFVPNPAPERSSARAPPMLTCTALHHEYLSGGRRLTVLKDITFVLEPGGFFAIV